MLCGGFWLIAKATEATNPTHCAETHPQSHFLPEVKMNRLSSGYALGILLAFVGAGVADEPKAITPDLSLVNDGKSFNVVNADAEITKTDGEPTIVNLKVKGGDIRGQSNIGLALVEGLEFSRGTIELDMKGFGRDRPCFLGIALNVVDEKTFESVHFRPFMFDRGNTEAIQYVSWPDYGWKKLRTRGYVAAVNPVPSASGWFHARFEVTAKQVKVFVDNAKRPSMVTNRISTRKTGKVGLWVDSGDGYFRNLKITPAK
jgi:hypothetical protein